MTSGITQAHLAALVWLIRGQECIVNRDVWAWLKETGCVKVVAGTAEPDRNRAYEVLTNIPLNESEKV
jgi:hypothetical protein